MRAPKARMSVRNQPRPSEEEIARAKTLTGVSYNNGAFQVNIGVNKFPGSDRQRLYLGMYDTVDEAGKVYDWCVSLFTSHSFKVCFLVGKRQIQLNYHYNSSARGAYWPLERGQFCLRCKECSKPLLQEYFLLHTTDPFIILRFKQCSGPYWPSPRPPQSEPPATVKFSWRVQAETD